MDSCRNCRFYDYDDYLDEANCTYTGKDEYIDPNDVAEMPAWCPVKKDPSKDK